MLPPINLKKWIDENRGLLKPPVCNKVVYEDTEFMIMVVGGPNIRKDYHVDEGEEFFYQLEGNMVLKIMSGGNPENIKSILEASGSSWENLIDITVFLTNMKNDFKKFNEIYNLYFPDAHACRTTVEVNALPTDIAVELKCIAMVNK